MRKYLVPVCSPHTPISIIEVIIKPSILNRTRGPPKMKIIRPTINPSSPKIDPKAIRNSIPLKTSSK